MSRTETVKALMKRDGITREAAEERYNDGRRAIDEALKNGFDPFMAWEEELGLEVDYFI